MDGKTIYILAGAPRSGKDSVIEFMTKHVFQSTTAVESSMVLSYSFIDDSRARAEMIGISPEKTPEYRKFLSDDADNLDNFDPQSRGYGYRVYRFLEWLENNTDARTACIMVNLRQMKGIISMGKAVHSKNYRVRILKVEGRGLTPEEMSNTGDKEYLSWPDEAFHHVFDNSFDLDHLEEQVLCFVNKERREIEDNIAAWNKTVESIQAHADAGTLETVVNIPPLPALTGTPVGEAFIVSVDAGDPNLEKSVFRAQAVPPLVEKGTSKFFLPEGEVKFLAHDGRGVIYSDFSDETNRKAVEAMSPPVKGGFNSADDFSLPVVDTGDPVQTGTGTTKPIRGHHEHITVFDDSNFVQPEIKVTVPVPAGTSFEDAIKYRENPNVSTDDYAHIYSEDKKDSE